MNKIKTPPHLLTLILLTGFSPLSLNMFMPSLTGIAVDLETDFATVSWSISGYLAITAVVQLIVGPLSDRIGRRPVLLVTVLVFAVSSVGCVLSQDIGTFLFFRMLQGGVTAGYTLSMAIVRDTRSEGQAVSLIGYIGMSMALAPMLGPVVGGVLDTAFGWRATFVFYAASGFILFVICWFDLGETRRINRNQPDAAPAKTSALMREPLFWAYSLCSAFTVGAFYIFLTGVPLVAMAAFSVSTAELGIYIGTITLGFMFGGFIAGRYGARFKLTTMMIAGRLVACAGLTVGLVLFSAGHTSPLLFFASTIFVGIGNGITMPGSNTGAMSIRKELAGSAAGISGAMVVAAGAILTAATGFLMPETDSARALLVLMLAAVLAGLFLAIYAARLKSPA